MGEAKTDLLKIYRNLHQIPELALHEFQTHDYLMKQIKQDTAAIDYAEIQVPNELPTAILVLLHGTQPKRTIGYRTDIDALPVAEDTGLDFSSKHDGVMHACGHDIHMTVALGVLQYFTQHQPTDNLLFFFQPAEESENGGKLAYEDGIFTGKWKPDEFYGLHDNPQLSAGAIGCRMGTLFAGTTEVDVDFTGTQGHAAYPQFANDMIVAASQFINQVQTIVSRSVDPIEGGVITFGQFNAGTIRNVISGSAHLKGTIRGLTQKMIEHIDERLQAVAKGIETSYDCQVDLKLNQGGYLPVENNDKLTADFINYMEENPKVDYVETEPAMTGEDFGYLLAKFPGTMFWLGIGDPKNQLHSSKLVPDTNAIQPGIDAITGFLQHRMLEKD
ncbi:N-acetyldiaminopimelate deacetylase [Fructilactobacillus lindneri]|uniref:N-acetyldiaminopimelate deacetylase n=2 Tax=Fructilactobacillus lindneri TaxID=53444 RepID=A0A0R2JMI5_9LACO|nr:N-acetyldiaminopimelate deacetylase [Fructilactobacillus lindneri]ANZ57667.1 N-acetyldiaminopimelate deacetylase [Fructilactobacillus lindneri]ANZ58937.1 N-acetyldiaminopimelate deacetylase [Fructilactobacillus lindneri]KRN78403.1 N-acetyldiaminopimelate deacetylase [Fructilactobacillus lindneri DSM 20690 = JCM 11027]POG97964.1 N-acetyldiaminopimelate deacetylase [Fructilactobacillus lindneri]POG99016.1 N-acetyldiaminopimelate deacetylase [Fructilactobacillus lindneri]